MFTELITAHIFEDDLILKAADIAGSINGGDEGFIGCIMNHLLGRQFFVNKSVN